MNVFRLFVGLDFSFLISLLCWIDEIIVIIVRKIDIGFIICVSFCMSFIFDCFYFNIMIGCKIEFWIIVLINKCCVRG